MTIQDIISELEKTAPLQYQESYDNAGLLVGDRNDEVHKILLTLDITEAVMEEALACEADLIIAHHPLIFKPLYKISNETEPERCVRFAIKNNIAIYACHTNMDAVITGVNGKICEKIGLEKCRILVPKEKQLFKIAVYTPIAYKEQICTAMYEAGAGCIGNYDNCGFTTEGTGSFKALDNAHPFCGIIGEIHNEQEYKIETICPHERINSVIRAIKDKHPYEEPAYDIYPIANTYELYGDGMIGTLPEKEKTIDFLKRIQDTFCCESMKHSKICKDTVRTIAVCGGSGSFLINDAIRNKADVFMTADIKYHDFFLADNKMVIADIGHYESEQFTKELFYELLNKKFYKFAIQISKVNTNPINYLYNGKKN